MNVMILPFLVRLSSGEHSSIICCRPLVRGAIRMERRSDRCVTEEGPTHIEWKACGQRVDTPRIAQINRQGCLKEGFLDVDRT